MRLGFTVVAVIIGTSLGACLPYTVGSTAHTVPAGETRRAGILYFIPHAVDLSGDSVGAPMRGTDVELRRGIDDRSDIGLRVPAYSGAVITYKRRVAGGADPADAALAVMAGGGFVNWGEHAEVELTVLASGGGSATVVPYGGARVMQVAPLSSSAVHDRPTAGGFVGLRLRFDDLSISPEIGLYHDRSALDLRRRDYIIVPGVTISRERREGRIARR